MQLKKVRQLEKAEKSIKTTKTKTITIKTQNYC